MAEDSVIQPPPQSEPAPVPVAPIEPTPQVPITPQPAEPVVPVPESVPVPIEPIQPTPPVIQPSTPVQTSPQPVLTPLPPKSFLAKALEAIQFRKKAKLDKIIKYVSEKGSITNDQAQKLLRISDSTAQRYLNVLVKQNRLKITGNQNSRRYEPVRGSNGGN